jgi:pyroglutamyl-peptidase
MAGSEKTILLTGFGPFPGAPFNPSGPLVRELARIRRPAFDGFDFVDHVFHTSYEAVDRELPDLLARHRPAALVMFGLAARTRYVRIETLARNARARLTPDISGRLPPGFAIAPDRPAALRLRASSLRLLAATRRARVPAALSRDAGRYLCNYLCWRAVEATAGLTPPPLVTFVHVPLIRRTALPRDRLRRPRLAMPDLVRAGEAVIQAAIAELRAPR